MAWINANSFFPMPKMVTQISRGDIEAAFWRHNIQQSMQPLSQKRQKEPGPALLYPSSSGSGSLRPSFAQGFKESPYSLSVPCPLFFLFDRTPSSFPFFHPSSSSLFPLLVHHPGKKEKRKEKGELYKTPPTAAAPSDFFPFPFPRVADRF